ncbi:GNAT family N-acetyltransferase [Amycolatopsis sp. H20-H5]|uniref:GNAT family N-acetyltransferase n=1 Tax=Amycolatopsis sp. H20-H5 TaxID=3046309 RepID=UPI002DB5987E|nr:GNAT family N-acetyltransferase [Amycolatopsis sp. H20-H5]MEC3977491.1 GNAT family N-acetyltransferase [Amycolatopsis sp. H20-H5]
MDIPDLLARTERNLAEHACHLHRGLSGASVTETADLLVADSGLDDDTSTARIAGTIRSVKATGRPSSWWVGPATTPSDLPGRLEAAGLQAGESEQANPKPPGGPSRTTCRPCRSSAASRSGPSSPRTTWPGSRPCSPPTGSHRRTPCSYFASVEASALDPACAARYLVGRHEGVVVCTAEVFSVAEWPGSTTSARSPRTGGGASAAR